MMTLLVMLGVFSAPLPSYPIRVEVTLVHDTAYGLDTNAWAAYGAADALDLLNGSDLFSVQTNLLTRSERSNLNAESFLQNAKSAPFHDRFRVLIISSCGVEAVQWTMSIMDTSGTRYLKKETFYRDKITRVQNLQEKLVSDFLSAIGVTDKLVLEALKKKIRLTRQDNAYENILAARLVLKLGGPLAGEMAARYYQKAQTGDAKINLREELARLETYRKNYDNAISGYNSVIAAEPTSSRAYRAVGDIYFDHKNSIKLAKEFYQKASEADANDQAAWLKLGYCAYSEKDYVIAKNYANQSLASAARNYPGASYRPSAESWNLLGNIAIAVRDTAEAIRCFSKAVEINPEEIPARKNLARIYEIKRQFGNARAQYRKILDHDPKESFAHLALANIDFYQKDQRSAAFHFIQAILAKPESESTRENPIQIFQFMSQNRKDLRPVSALCDTLDNLIIEGDLTESDAWIVRSTLGYAKLYYLNDASAAANELQIAAKLNPAAPLILLWLSDAYFQLGRWDASLEASLRYTQFAEDSYSFSRCYLLRGKALIKQKRYDEAQGEILKSLRVLPNAEAYFQHGLALRGALLIDEAIAAFEKSIRLFPGFAQAHHELGRTFAAAKKYDKAIPALQKAISLDSNDYRFRQSLAQVFLTLERFEDAELQISISAKKLAGMPDAAVEFDFGEALLFQKRYGEAKPHYERSLGADSSQGNAAYRLAMIFAINHDAPQALVLLETALRKNFTDFNALSKEKAFLALKTTPAFEDMVGRYERANREALMKKIK